MAEKSAHQGRKRGYQKIDEENDVFLSFINKKKRNNKKKLTEIEELEKRDQSTLKPEQVAKIKTKPEIKKQNDYWNEIKDLYYQALKSNQDEGGKKLSLKKEATQPQEKPSGHEEPKIGQKSQSTQAKTELIQPIVNLIHMSELFSRPAVKEEFDKVYLNASSSLGLTSFPDFNAVHELSNKVFRITETDVNQTVGKKLETAAYHLERFVDAVGEVAAADKSYVHIADVVNKLAVSDFVKGYKITSEQRRSHHHHLSPLEEHKHEHRHEHKHEPPKQNKTFESPTRLPPEGSGRSHEEPKKPESSAKKETLNVQPIELTTQNLRPQQEKTEDWTLLDNEEDEEAEYQGDDEYTEEEKNLPKVNPEQKAEGKPNDGFVEVKAKYLEKKKGEETSRGVEGGRRRGGGRRGGGRGGGHHGEWRGERRGGRRGGHGRRGGKTEVYVPKQETTQQQQP